MSIVLTWTRPMSPATLLAGWNGAGAVNLVVRLVDGGVERASAPAAPPTDCNC